MLLLNKPEAPNKKSQGKSDPELLAMHNTILRNLGHALVHATKELRDFTENKLENWEHRRVQHLISLARITPKILPLIEQEREATVMKYPECIICEGVSGEHWAHECPRLHHPKRFNDWVFDYHTKKAYERKSLGHAITPFYGITPFQVGTEPFQKWWDDHGHKHFKDLNDYLHSPRHDAVSALEALTTESTESTETTEPKAGESSG